jgi:hypothetical protein
MLSKRAQDRISGTLSGWYTSEWTAGEIVWANDRLMVKSKDLADEIAYNLKHDLGTNLGVASSTVSEFANWSEVTFG